MCESGPAPATAVTFALLRRPLTQKMAPGSPVYGAKEVLLRLLPQSWREKQISESMFGGLDCRPGKINGNLLYIFFVKHQVDCNTLVRIRCLNLL